MSTEPVLLDVLTYRKEIRTVTGTCYTSAQWVYESMKCIDHANSSDRKWLASHQFWAARNGRQVTLTPRGKSDVEYVEMGKTAR